MSSLENSAWEEMWNEQLTRCATCGHLEQGWRKEATFQNALLKNSYCYTNNSTPGSLLHDKLHFTVAQSYLKHERYTIQFLEPAKLGTSHCRMHCLFNFHCSWHHSFALCKHVLTKRVEGWKGGEGWGLGVKCTGGGWGFRVRGLVRRWGTRVLESWRWISSCSVPVHTAPGG